MSQILTKRRARKPYVCDNEYPASDAFLYGHPNIEPGQVYARLALTPHDYEIGNTGWMVALYCSACAEDLRGWFAS